MRRRGKKEEPGVTLSRKMLTDARVIAKGSVFVMFSSCTVRWKSVAVGQEEQPAVRSAGARFGYHWYEHHGVGPIRDTTSASE